MALAKRLLLWIILASGPATCLYAQSGAIRQAEKKIAQGNFDAAHQLLLKSLRKDTINPEVEISLAKWFLNEKNPHQQIDSAYLRCLSAQSHYAKLNVRHKQKLKREEFDSMTMVQLRIRIDSVAFDQAKRTNTEKSYNEFLTLHKNSLEHGVATELRDEAAFLDALKQNTYSAFENYIQRYPSSIRAREAKSRYEKLLYETLTRDHKLKSYEAFVRQFPNSPFRRVAMKNIFEPLTSGGTVAEFTRFIEQYPTSYFTRMAKDIVFHLTRESEEKFPENLMSDSLTNAIQLNRLPLVPIFKNGKFGFMDSDGKEVLPIQFESILEDYKCGSVTEDILVTSTGLVSRTGRVLSFAKFFKDLGYGFLKVKDSTCFNVLHKSGRLIVKDCIQDAVVLDGKFLRIEKNNLFGLHALNGRVLLKPEWVNIEFVEGVMVLDRGGKKILSTPLQLEEVADGNPLLETFVFDDVKSVGKNRLLVTNGPLQGIINSNLEFVVPLAIQSLAQAPFGLVRKINDQFSFPDIPELNDQPWDLYSVHYQWLHLKNKEGDILFDSYSRRKTEANSDSLWFAKGLAFARKRDSVNIHINSRSKVSLPVDSKVLFIKSPDSIRYFYAEHKNKKSIFSVTSGERMFTTDADGIESLNENYFVITKRGKKGLASLTGKLILPIEYDAMILNSGKLSLLKGQKFGWYNLASKELIKPLYEKNIVSLNNHLMMAFHDGHYGLIDRNGKAISNFEFDEIQPWGDSVVWVKKDFEWSLMDVYSRKKLVSRVKDFHPIKDRSTERISIFRQEDLYGVVSNRRGTIIPPSFSMIMNLGTEDEPIYFTSKEVEEAGIVAVIYYDKMGNFVRKQVYEEEEFSRIVCKED